MVDVSEDQDSERADIQRYLGVAQRRHMHFLIPAFFGWLIVWGASWVLQPRYKSSTLILVEQPTMPKNYVQPNVSDDLQDRLQSITQQILSRTRLLMIIDKMHLYSSNGTHESITADEKVNRMRKDINIELVRDSRNNEITAFRIFYSAQSPYVAQQVTSELTDLFINENLKVRQEESEGTTKFIENQLEDARASLSEQEAKVQKFEGQHEGVLPSQQASNLQILSGLQAQLQNEQDALNTARQQRVYLQALIEQYRTLQGRSKNADATAADLPAIDQELSRLKTKLAALSSQYTDKYPDVQSLKDQIATTEKMRNELIAGLKNGSNSRQADGVALARVPDPAQDAPALQLEGQLQSNQLEITNREAAVGGLKARINDYQGRLNAQPITEQQLADLTRGYEQSKANYDDLLKKKNESVMATSMEQMQQGERFTMLDPPSLPVKPDFPNRLKFCGIGLAVGLTLGVLVVFGFEFMDDRLHSDKNIKALLPVAVISEIPEIITPSDEQKKKKRMALGWAMSAIVVVAILAGSAYSYLHG